MFFVKLIMTILLLTIAGCAIDPTYEREYPGIQGVVLDNNKPLAGIKVVYARSHSKKCDLIIGTDTTNDKGVFRIPVERTFQLIELFPMDGCEFEGTICMNGMALWKFRIQGKGNKEYHTGGSIRKDPERVLVLDTEGYCYPPKWMTIECELESFGEKYRILTR